MFKNSIEKLINFRKTLHELIPSYRDAAMDLIDALSTNRSAGSVTELSENRCFRRQYSSLTKVIHYFLVTDKKEAAVDQEAQPASLSDPVDRDLRPNKEIQQAIRQHIVNQAPAPEQRKFFVRQRCHAGAQAFCQEAG